MIDFEICGVGFAKASDYKLPHQRGGVGVGRHIKRASEGAVTRTILFMSQPTHATVSYPNSMISDFKSYPADVADAGSQPAALTSLRGNPAALTAAQSQPNTANTAFVAAVFLMSNKAGVKAADDAMLSSEEDAPELAVSIARTHRCNASASAAAKKVPFRSP